MLSASALHHSSFCTFFPEMAEIFGAVASGAGLVSLSMQLLESSQKLKGFYDLCRDAPETVRLLSFDLETMSMALRQFEQYRQNDVFGGDLLGRCILACEQAVAKITTTVDKIHRLLCKARVAGRLYMGFKEPEVRKLLEEMEHAKSSMLLAYTSYCQYVCAPEIVMIPLTDSGDHGICGKLQSVPPRSHIKVRNWRGCRPVSSQETWR
jgi:hypothetical protein